MSDVPSNYGLKKNGLKLVFIGIGIGIENEAQNTLRSLFPLNDSGSKYTIAMQCAFKIIGLLLRNVYHDYAQK